MKELIKILENPEKCVKVSEKSQNLTREWWKSWKIPKFDQSTMKILQVPSENPSKSSTDLKQSWKVYELNQKILKIPPPAPQNPNKP